MTHTFSHICFLVLLAAATFRLDTHTYPITYNLTSDLFIFHNNNSLDANGMNYDERLERLLMATFRPANVLMTNVQICLMFWIFGLLWMECKAMYKSGLRVYLLDSYNWIDFIVLSVYMSSYVLRFLVDHRIKAADLYYNGTSRAREALHMRSEKIFYKTMESIFSDNNQHSYFMKASRFQWKPDDPEIVSDVLFAVANVLSIARTTYLMPAFEVLGPLQISLGRMIGDITRFLVLFTLVLFAFMVGLHNLYWYYGSQTYRKEGTDKLVHTSEAFQGLPRTLYSLFWSMFGLVNIESIEIKFPNKEGNSDISSTFPGGNHATSVVEGVGMFLFALYHVAIIIVLINMLIAMMSHSFEDIQTDCDVEWKFARTGLWLNYIDNGGTLPVPYNMIPTPKSLSNLYHVFTQPCQKSESEEEEEEEDGGVGKIRFKRKLKNKDTVCENVRVHGQNHSYSDILQRLVRRYMFKLERQREENKENINILGENIVTTLNRPFDLPDTQDPSLPPNYNSVAGESESGNRRKTSIKTKLTGRQKIKNFNGPNQLQVQVPQPQIQLLSIPQLDSIQRTLRILDVRLQHVQNNNKEDEKVKDDIDHIRKLMAENQNALLTVVTVLSSIQEEVRRLSITAARNNNFLQIHPPKNRNLSFSSTVGSSSNKMKGVMEEGEEMHEIKGKKNRKLITSSSFQQDQNSLDKKDFSVPINQCSPLSEKISDPK